MKQPVCVIVGAGEGLGRALAVKFANHGLDIALISRTEAGSAAALAAVKSVSGRAKFFTADVTQPETVEAALGQIMLEMGDIDLLIYNARDTFTACEPLDMTYAALEQSFRIEVVGAFAAAKSVLPRMIQRATGGVFFSSATAAFRGSGTHPLYSIGKFGLRGLSQSLAKAYSKDGVHIVHFRLDCDLDVPIMRALYHDRGYSGHLADPDDVAEAYRLTYLQPKTAWSNEVEIRPHTENWTY